MPPSASLVISDIVFKETLLTPIIIIIIKNPTASRRHLETAAAKIFATRWKTKHHKRDH